MTDKIHVAHIVHSFGIGGCENGIVNLVNNMDLERFQFSILSLSANCDSARRIKRKDVICEVVEKRLGNDLSLPFKLASFLRKHRVHIVHTHGWGTFLEGLLAAKMAGISVVMHGEHGTDQLDRWYRRVAYRLGVLGTNKILTVSKYLRTRLINHSHVPSDKIETISNGVDTRLFIQAQELRATKRRELGFGDSDVVVGTIGRPCYEKNYGMLLKASAVVAEKQEKFFLLIIGEGPDRAALQQLTNTLGINNRVTFLGKRDDTVALLNAMDVFVLSSRSEGLPNTILEAMSVGLPVLSTNVGGVAEILSEPGLGLLVDPMNVESFAKALEQLVRSPDLRCRLGKAGQWHIFEKFGLDRMVTEYEKAYTLAIHPAGSPSPGLSKDQFLLVSPGLSASHMVPVSHSKFLDPISKIVTHCVLPCVALFTSSKFWSLCRELQQGAPAKVFRPTPGEVFERVRDLVAHSYQNVAFYRERFQSLGLAPDCVKTLEDFKKIPPTTKADILANFPDRMTSKVALFQPWRYVSTSGTVQRMTAIQDFRKREYIRATQLLGMKIGANYEPGMRYMEIPPDICTDVCGASDSLEPPLFTYLWENLKKGSVFNPETISNLWGLVERQIIYRRLQLPALCPDGLVQNSHKLSSYIEKIDAYRPHVLKALPVYLYVLALHMLKEKLRPPRITGCLMPMGSSLTPHMKQVVQEAFQCPVHEDYGCAELGSVAVECGHQRGFHPLSSLFLRGSRLPWAARSPWRNREES